jgi:hypothetical protein
MARIGADYPVLIPAPANYPDDLCGPALPPQAMPAIAQKFSSAC